MGRIYGSLWESVKGTAGSKSLGSRQYSDPPNASRGGMRFQPK